MSSVECLSLLFYRERFLTSETLGTEMTSKCKFFDFSNNQTICSPKYWLHFVHQSINLHFSICDILLAGQTMHVVPCTWNVMGQTCRKLKIGLVRPDIHFRFTSKQNGQFFLCITLLGKHILKYAPCTRTLKGWNWQKCDFSQISHQVIQKATSNLL